jgi:hypothetical protein
MKEKRERNVINNTRVSEISKNYKIPINYASAFEDAFNDAVYKYIESLEAEKVEEVRKFKSKKIPILNLLDLIVSVRYIKRGNTLRPYFKFTTRATNKAKKIMRESVASQKLRLYKTIQLEEDGDTTEFFAK